MKVRADIASQHNGAPVGSPGLLPRVRRAWIRDNNLGVIRRVQKAMQLAVQLLRAHVALRICNRVGSNARVAGRMRVVNNGAVRIGDHLNVNSNWVPVELLTGRDGCIEIGDDVLINFGTVIAATQSVSIGHRTMIGPHCVISDTDIPDAAIQPRWAATSRPIVIGEDVWLAARVTVRPGVTIGNGAVIVAGSIVESDVPAGMTASGIPARSLPKVMGQRSGAAAG